MSSCSKYSEIYDNDYSSIEIWDKCLSSQPLPAYMHDCRKHSHGIPRVFEEANHLAVFLSSPNNYIESSTIVNRPTEKTDRIYIQKHGENKKNFYQILKLSHTLWIGDKTAKQIDKDYSHS